MSNKCQTKTKPKMKTALLSLLFLLTILTGCQNSMYDNFRFDSKLESSFNEIFKGEDVVLGEKTNPKVKDETIFNLYSIMFLDKEPLKPIEYTNLTVFDTLVNYYSICINDYETNKEFLRVTKNKKPPTKSDSLYQDSVKNWNDVNYHKYVCNSRYLQTVKNHPERYKKVVLTKCKYDQNYEIVINDKLSFFSSIRVYIVNGKLSTETTTEMKKSYEKFLIWKSENCN